MSDTNAFYKLFLNNLASVELGEMYLILNESVLPRIKTYMNLLMHTPFNEDTYHKYYGDVKNITESFFLYWTQVMDENIKTAHEYNNLTGSNIFFLREKVLNLLEKTVDSRTMLQKDFEKEFVEIKSQSEEENLINKFQTHLFKLQELIKQLETFDFQELQMFVSTNTCLFLTSVHKILEFASHQIATFLTDNHKKILISLEENVNRVTRNLQSPTFAVLNDLFDKIYSTNNNLPVQTKLTKELKHWQSKLQEFLHIKNILTKLEKVKTKLIQEHEPQPANEGMEMHQKLEELKKLEIDVTKSILTFFSIEGANRLYHSEALGSFFMDEYGHKVYSLNYGLNRFHTCGDYFMEVQEDYPYYDENGRYIIENGQKLYKAAPCCSAYKLDLWGIFVKASDSGYPSRCKEEISKSYYDTIKAQEKESAKSKVKINKAAAIYLWNNLGDILTKSLLDIAKRQPKNAIHCLAHTLLYYKYHKTSKDTPELPERLVPKTEPVFKTTKTPLVEQHKTKLTDEDQETFASNIAQQFLFNLFEQ